MVAKKETKNIELKRENIEAVLRALSARCRDEAEDPSSLKIGYGGENTEIAEEIVAAFFEKMAEIFEDAVDSL